MATVKSSSVFAGETPLGSFTWPMWIEFADLQSVERHVDLRGDARRVAYELELVLDDVEHAAALQARRCVFIVEAHRHGDMNLGVLADTQEIDVDRAACNRMEIHRLRQCPVRLALQNPP